MVILHLLAPVHAGGLERVVHSLALGQQERGHHVAVAAILDAEGEAETFFPPLERAGVPVHRIIVPPRAYLGERRAVRSLVRALSPHVVHSHGYRTDVVDGGVIRRLGIATVASAHGFSAGPWRNRVYEGLQRAALRRFDAVIAVSQPLGDMLRRAGVATERLHVVPNAFMQIVEPLERAPARACLDLPADEFVVGWVGRMVREKGLDVLIDAVAMLTDLKLIVCAIGAGPERNTQESRARGLGLADCIRWRGLVPEAARYFKAFDVYALSSRTEGVPISLFEAMASGVPIVASRVGGVPHVIAEEHALLVDRQQPVRLADALRAVHDDRPAAAARARLARRRLTSEFGTESWLARHDEVYAAAREMRSRR